MSDENTTSVARQLGDEIKLQAWLAGAELRHPSLGDTSVRTEVDALAAMRDRLKLQVHLASMDAREAFDRAERAWETFAARASQTVGAGVEELLGEIRAAYARIEGDDEA